MMTTRTIKPVSISSTFRPTTKSEKLKKLLSTDIQAVTTDKKPYGVILETPKGFFKRRKLDTNNIPYGVFLARAYRYNECYINIKDKGI